MPSGVFDSTLLKHMWGTDELRAVFNDENRVQKWYDYEAALALAQAELDKHPEAIGIGADPYVIIRPEGDWDRPGVLDLSSTRAAASPLRSAAVSPT